MLPVISIKGTDIYIFPFIIAIALIVCFLIYVYSPKYEKIYRVIVLRLCVPVMFGSAIGARLTSAITLTIYNGSPFLKNLIYGGAVFYGGIIGAMTVLYVLCRRNRYDFLAFTDVFASLLPIGHAIGRLGCYLNGCCYGKEYEGMFATAYIVDGLCVSVFPTWFFETFFCVLLFVYIRSCCSSNRIGRRTSIYLLAYSIYRFFMEFMRGDEIRGTFYGISTSQIFSIIVFLNGLFVFIRSYKNKQDNYLFKKGVVYDEC